jgi:hypothetical protein
VLPVCADSGRSRADYRSAQSTLNGHSGLRRHVIGLAEKRTFGTKLLHMQRGCWPILIVERLRISAETG